MGRLRWYLIAGAALLTVSGLGFTVLIFGFHRSSDALFYLVLDLTFLPIQVLIVTLVINRLLQVREQTELGQRVNIVISVFFWEMGTDLLRFLSLFDEHLDDMRAMANVNENWTSRDFATMRRRIQHYDYSIDCRCAELQDLKDLLEVRRDFLRGLLTNSSLLENESFTEVLWAVGHLTRELDFRTNLDNLPQSDYDHLGEDMRRVYVLMVKEWLSYMQRLQHVRSYSFSLAVRLNPLAENPSPVVEEEEQ